MRRANPRRDPLLRAGPSADSDAPTPGLDCVAEPMADAVIDNPILNSPYQEPSRHFVFGESGITSQVGDGRRVSSYFMPIPAARRKAQLDFDAAWTRDRIEENRFINRIRE